MIELFRDEAVAYLRLGLLAPGGRSAVRSGQGRRAAVGVLFVPGVGANGSQFTSMKQALEGEVGWFDSFEYPWLMDPRRNAERLAQALERAADVERLVVVGHSLGGLLLRLVLQTEPVPANVLGYAAICSPLHGTWRSRLTPHPGLRLLAPDSALMEELRRTAGRLDRWKDRILTVGARRDQFIDPYTSAFLDGTEQLLLEDVAHAGSLFDPRVHARVRALVERVKESGGGADPAGDGLTP
jgi:pimeloyl-ACP methyl ester carboxylesterase